MIFSMGARMEIIVGRIETLVVDAVVNAANRELLPGTGVDGALRRAAGPALTALTQTLPPLAESEAVLTPGFDAPARFILHTAAPIWWLEGEERAKIAALAACYRACVALAGAHALRSVAFPCLGTGNFGWPRERACAVAVEACGGAVREAASVERVVFCCFTAEDAEFYRAVLG
jgi:O-acetyl-ADP-ribose deacetylase (regulator of RNase III)